MSIKEAGAIIQFIGEDRAKTMSSSDMVKGLIEISKEVDGIVAKIKEKEREKESYGDRIKDDLKSQAIIGGYWE